MLRALSQRELAKRAGIGVSTLNELENYVRKPRPITIRKLATGLKVKISDLVVADELDIT